MAKDFLSIDDYRNQYSDTTHVLDDLSDDALAEKLYNEYKDDERMQGLSLEEYKKRVITKAETREKTSRQKRKEKRHKYSNKFCSIMLVITTLFTYCFSNLFF